MLGDSVLLLAVVCVPLAWVWGWVELGRCWVGTRQTDSVPRVTQRSTEDAPVLPIPRTPLDEDEGGAFIRRTVQVLPVIQAHVSYRRRGRRR